MIFPLLHGTEPGFGQRAPLKPSHDPKYPREARALHLYGVYSSLVSYGILAETIPSSGQLVPTIGSGKAMDAESRRNGPRPQPTV